VERPPSPADDLPARKPAPAPALPATSFSLFQEPGFETAPLPPAERPSILRVLAEEVAICRKCAELAATRTQTVFADGSPSARLMFIGEAPGADEDRTGVPFVGRAGQLLTDMITKGMGLRRQDVYIANILKCRPPENREPSGEESANCLPYLERQIDIIRPEFICLLGRVAVQYLLGTTLSMGKLRGKWYRYQGIATIVTYHPAYLLRTPSAKKDAWDDLQILMNAMGLPVPSRKKGQD
jgi:uracil-DNA glycosylase